MKNLIIVMVVLILLPGASEGSGPYRAYWFTDGDDPSAEAFQVSVSIYSPYIIRNWIRNDTINGFLTCQFGVDLGSDLVQGTTTNTDIATSMGSPVTENWVVTFSECQYDEWVWLCRYEMFYAGTPHCTVFLTASESGKMNVATCEGGPEGDLPLATLDIGSQFGVNMYCMSDAEEDSWGAVKAIYR